MKNNKGITLVALVVTIVVLLILAGVSINLVLGDNGIVKKAQDAKTKTAEDQENMLTGMNQLADEIDNLTGGNGNGGQNFMTKNTEVTYLDGKVWIPEGFKVADDSASTVQGGVVIEDKDGNQFVWVPVATIADYKRTWYDGISSLDSYSETLPEDEKTSVETYKGFYIGRYEAGDKESTEASTPALRTSSSSTSNKISIKAGQAPYNYVTRDEAKSLAEGFKTQQNYSSNIKNKLVSSYAWDTTIAFIQKVNSDYGSSSEEGNYSNTTFSYTDITGASQTKAKSSSVLVPTGQTTPVCNIYDMGGNVWEWTTESFLGTSTPCVLRGGSYDYGFANSPAGNRNCHTGTANVGRGFRLTLFM